MKLILATLAIYVSTAFFTSPLSCSDLNEKQEKDKIRGQSLPNEMILEILPYASIKVGVATALTSKDALRLIFSNNELWEDYYQKILGSELFPLPPLGEQNAISPEQAFSSSYIAAVQCKDDATFTFTCREVLESIYVKLELRGKHPLRISGSPKSPPSLAREKIFLVDHALYKKRIIQNGLSAPLKAWVSHFRCLSPASLSGNGVVSIGVSSVNNKPSYFRYNPLADKVQIQVIQDNPPRHNQSSAVDYSGQYFVTINEDEEKALIWERDKITAPVHTIDNITHIKSIRRLGEEITLLGIMRKQRCLHAVKITINGTNIQRQILAENPSHAWAMTPNAETVVGSLSFSPEAPEQACIWQKDGKIIRLGLPGFKGGQAVGISANGDTVIGNMYTSYPPVDYASGFLGGGENEHHLNETKAFIACKLPPQKLAIFRDNNQVSISDEFVTFPLESLIDLPNLIVHAMSSGSSNIRISGRYRTNEFSPFKPFIWDEWHKGVIDLNHLIKNFDARDNTGRSVHIEPNSAISTSENGAVILIKGIEQLVDPWKIPLCVHWHFYLPRYDILAQEGVNFKKLEILKKESEPGDPFEGLFSD